MIVQRLLEVIEHSGLSQTAFAKKIGSTQANLWRQLNGQKVNVATIMAVAQQFPEIDCNWLLRGEGAMVKGTIDNAQERRIDGLLDVVATQQETINNLMEKIKQLQNQ
jgi:transcriptional regulator with XRE-family HTH domain